jgi:hypothetical protein
MSARYIFKEVSGKHRCGNQGNADMYKEEVRVT